MHAGQERAADPAMAAGRLARRRQRGLLSRPVSTSSAIAKWRERLQDRRQLEVAAFGGRCPAVHHRALRHVHDPQAARRLRGVVATRGQRRHHAVEQRQRERRAESAQHRPPREGFLGDDHDSDLLI